MEKVLRYLTELEFNNNREWFGAAKRERTEANCQFEEFVQSLIFSIGEHDESVAHNVARELTFKAVRDTRFSADKSPYNPSMRAHIAAKGKLPIPVGYYVMIKPNDRSFLGGGLFADMFNNATIMLRDYIAENGDELIRIVKSESFKRYFAVKGVALKNVPKGYDPNSPYAEWLKYKCMYLEYPIKDDEILKPNFVAKATEIFLAMKPFNDFINEALKEFIMPQRP